MTGPAWRPGTSSRRHRGATSAGPATARATARTRPASPAAAAPAPSTGAGPPPARRRFATGAGAARWRRQSAQTRLGTCSGFQGEPDFHAADAAGRIEMLVVAFKIGRVGHFQPGLWQPLVPQRMPGDADGGNMPAVVKHGIALRRDAQ